VWSDEIERILGRQPDPSAAPDEALAFIDAKGDRDRLRDAALGCMRDGTSFVETFPSTSGDGRRLWLNVMGEATRDGEGHIVGIAGALQDVTLWKEAEAMATAQRQRFAQFANAVPSIIWTAEPDGEIDYFNVALADYTGRAAKDLLGVKWLEAVHHDDVEHTVAEWQRSVATGEAYAMAFRLRRADGEYRWFRVAAKPERADDGTIVKWWGHASDVHEYFLLEAEASALAKERSDILESIGDGVFTLDRESRFTYLNSKAEQFVERSAADLLGRNVWDVFPEIRDTPIAEASVATAAGDAQRFTLFYSPLNKWFDVNATPTSTGLTVYFRDTTELKSMADQLAQAQRMESVGRLTGGIAHDFNNLLTVVVGGAEALDDEPNLTDEGREMLTLVASAASRGAELTHRLLAFARRQPLAPQVVDIADRIRAMTPILERAIGAGISTVPRLEEGLPNALVDPGQLENALLNLAINAGDAMPTGGIITISAELAHLDEAYSTMHAEVQPGTYILISVGDTGTGIPSADLPHIFEPFFTTKAEGDGSGLGLAMVWGFAMQTGGHVTVYSEEGFGTIVRLYVPVAADDAVAADAFPPSLETPMRGSGHILLAEDDPLVQKFAAERLRDHGYTVTVASTGGEALELVDGIDDLSLLFTDVIMKGGVSGRELADEVLTRRPETPVLFASGYAADIVVHKGRLDPGVDLLAKPYTGRQLLERVRSVIETGAGVGKL
jgi:PAS domain S-box-containing protein